MKTSFRTLALLVVMTSLPFSTACNLNTGWTVTDIPTAPASETPVPYQDCGWNWATQPLPELTDQVQRAMEEAGLKDVTARAEAYGENCFGPTGEVLYFATMETDFKVTAVVRSLDDRTALGTLLERILVVLDGFPTGSTPGSNPGYIGVTFQAGGAAKDELRLWFTVTDWETARDAGLHGAALLDKLQKK